MLTFSIEKKWFDMILSGEKKEKYLNIKPYYKIRLVNAFFDGYQNYILYGDTLELFLKSGNSEKYLAQVMFRNGYGKNSPSFIADCSLNIKQGKAEWGAEKGVDYYVLTIHKIIWKSMDNMGGYLIE